MIFSTECLYEKFAYKITSIQLSIVDDRYTAVYPELKEEEL